MALFSSDNSSTPTTTFSDHFRTTSTRKPKNPSTLDPNPQQLPSIMQSTSCKSSISSLIISTFNKTNNNNTATSSTTSKKYVKGTSLLGFGCTSQQQVSVPGVIRSSANWVQDDNNNKSLKKKKKKKKQQQKLQQVSSIMEECSVVQDLWCGADSSSVDCVRPLPSSSRNKIDLHKLHLHNHNHNHIIREHGSYSSRQRVNNEHVGGLNLESAFDASNIGPDVFEARYYRHLRNRSPEGLAEILMFQNGLLMGRRSGGLDRYRDWRLDVDSMTYEELLELGEKIGHVNTGLGEDQIGRCLRKTKLSVVDEMSSQSRVAEVEPKCSICQEEYEEDDEMGKLECGHAYHLYCIKQWLTRKNACPVCKTEASSQ